MKNPFRIILGIVLFLALISSAVSQTVNRDELEQNQANVNFINYEGPYSRIDTVAAIRNIGFELGRAVRNGATRAGQGNRYFVIHCVGDPDGDKFDADVFGLGADVAVDHIRNLRLIIQGYLEGAYDYTAADAALLARFITIYNAVFRGDWEFFNTRYKDIVIENLVQERAGLSIRWDEWAGQTLMTIPLGTGIFGSLSAIDTSGLTDPSVIDTLRAEEGRGIEDRQDMVDLMEREADDAAQEATLQRLAIAEEEANIQRAQEESRITQQRVEQDRQQAQQQQEEAQRQQQEAQRQQEEARRQQEQARQDEAAGRISSEEAQRQQQEAQQQQEEAQRQQQQAQQQQEEARRQQEEAQRQQQTIDQQQREIAQREQEQEQRRQEAEATQRLADQRTEAAQQERQQIAQDQQEMIDSGSQAGVPIAGAATTPGTTQQQISGLLAASILQSNTSLGRLLRVNPNDGATVQSSPMNSINTRTIILSGNRIFAIAGIDRGNAAIRLVEINNNTLEMLKQGNDDIHQNSLLWVNGNNLYAITVSDGKNYLARFDQNLERQAISTVEVHPHASCLFQGDRILTQRADGTPLLLNGQTLR